jgi:hypothetical protein
MKKLKPTTNKLPTQNSRLLVSNPIINQTPMPMPLQGESNSVDYLESIANPNIDNQVRMSNTRNPLFADNTMLSEGALNEINRLNQTQIPMAQSAINEDEDIRGGGIGIGQALAQSLAMLGAGVRGGDVGQVGRIFDLNRQESFRQGQYQKQKQKIKEQENTAKQYVDPNSEISIQERAKAEELYPFPIPKNLSYADINNKNVIQALQAKYNATQEQKSLEEQKGLQSRLDDPNSPESIKLRNDLNLLRIDVPKGLSANKIKEYYPRLLELSKPQPMIGGGGVRGGGVRQEKPEKESKEDIKNIQSFKDATVENQKFLKQLDDYSKIVKEIPITGGTTASGASKIAAAQSLRGKLLFSLKNIEKTGALDQGMINIADGILGSPDYTRNEVVDARTNQLKQTIQDEIQASASKYGIIGTAQGEDGKLYYVDKNNNPVMQVK